MSNHVRQLIAQLRDPNPRIRVLAARETKRLSESAASAVPALMAMLADRFWLAAATAADALGQMGASATIAVPDLTRALGHADTEVRRSAAMALGSIQTGDKQTISELGRLAQNDASPEVRTACSEALDRCRASRPKS